MRNKIRTHTTMTMQYFKPQQGDTASAVAEGYDNNFKTLDTAVGNLETHGKDLDQQLSILRDVVAQKADTDDVDAKDAAILSGAKEYTDSKDAATLGSAKSYTDTVAGGLVPLTDSRLSDPRDAIQHNGGGSLKLWAGTQAEYDALPAKADDTLYFIR